MDVNKHWICKCCIANAFNKLFSLLTKTYPKHKYKITFHIKKLHHSRCRQHSNCQMPNITTGYSLLLSATAYILYLSCTYSLLYSLKRTIVLIDCHRSNWKCRSGSQVTKSGDSWSTLEGGYSIRYARKPQALPTRSLRSWHTSLLSMPDQTHTADKSHKIRWPTCRPR